MMELPQPRDFLETREGLMFAVVEGGLEAGRALCFLRYRRERGAWHKLGTDQANRWLQACQPDYLYYSPSRDARLHGVPMGRVVTHHRPRQRLARLLGRGPADLLEDRLCRLLVLLRDAGAEVRALGVTGSLLIGAHRPDSDFDLVAYGREAFFRARRAVEDLLQSGRLQPLSEALWRETYERRGCALDYEDYLRHERRKHNKAAFEGTKFDLALVVEEAEPAHSYHKRGAAILRARVVDASRAFDHPARYRLDHAEVGEAVSYTHTYVGQALAGETVEIAGQLEEVDDGSLRIVVGSSREAPGEYIRVCWPRQSGSAVFR